MISTLYVALRLDHALVSVQKGRNIGVETLAYTQSKTDGMQFIETVAARDVYNKDWSYELHGDPFYDPQNDEDLPPPPGKFAVWDDNIERDDVMLNRPTSVVASASIFSEHPKRTLLRSYKLCLTNPLVSDFIAYTTDKDLEVMNS